MKQLIVYFLLAFGLSWLIWLPLYGPSLGLKGLPAIPFNHAIGGLGPMLAAIITSLVFSKARGTKQFILKGLRPVSWRYLLIALLSPFLLYLLAAAVSYLVSGNPIDLEGIQKVKEFPRFNLLSFFVYNLIFFGFGEEFGWRGFALPRFQARLHPITAAGLLTCFWALWHLPLFLYRPGYTGMDVYGAMGWGISLLTGSILLTWLYNSSKGSVLICAVFHSTIDIIFTADIADKNINGYMGALITLWGIGTLFFLKRKKGNPRGSRQ